MKGLRFFCAFFGALVSLSPAFAAKNTSAKPSPAPIRQEMGGLFVALSDLLPLVISKADFENQKNAKELLSLMRRIEGFITEDGRQYEEIW